MKRVTLEIPDGFDEILTFTCIGNIKKCVNASINAIEIENHNGDTYVIRTAPGTTSEWVKGDNKGEVKPDEIANPVKHGKWIDKGNAAGLFCSECDFKVRYRDERRFKYCPHCGAKMGRSD